MTTPSNPPVVLCLSGLDPSGGAGISADIEAIAANGGLCAPLISCLTAQDSIKVAEIRPVAEDFLLQQAQLVLADYQIRAFKTGLLGSLAAARIANEIVSGHPGIPFVLDPVLAATGGGAEASAELRTYIAQQLIPKAWLLTPNRKEARALTGLDSPEQAAQALLDLGCRAVLLTGADESDGDLVVNQLYQRESLQTWNWPKLEGSYHGSGCTLAASAAAWLARGASFDQAASQAQDYTWKALSRASQPGHGQLIPSRFPACNP